MWNQQKLVAMSGHPIVKRVVALGTVVAVEIKTRCDHIEGYSSNAASDVVDGLRRRGVYARPLGDVAYVMVTPMTKHETCE
jgi:dethiobiotin synthetase/adenosylmethionine--8-amino-7-oxononanoate aminotransferase